MPTGPPHRNVLDMRFRPEDVGETPSGPTLPPKNRFGRVKFRTGTSGNHSSDPVTGDVVEDNLDDQDIASYNPYGNATTPTAGADPGTGPPAPGSPPPPSTPETFLLQDGCQLSTGDPGVDPMADLMNWVEPGRGGVRMSWPPYTWVPISFPIGTHKQLFAFPNHTADMGGDIFDQSHYNGSYNVIIIPGWNYPMGPGEKPGGYSYMYQRPAYIDSDTFFATFSRMTSDYINFTIPDPKMMANGVEYTNGVPSDFAAAFNLGFSWRPLYQSFAGVGNDRTFKFRLRETTTNTVLQQRMLKGIDMKGDFADDTFGPSIHAEMMGKPGEWPAYSFDNFSLIPGRTARFRPGRNLIFEVWHDSAFTFNPISGGDMWLYSTLDWQGEIPVVI